METKIISQAKSTISGLRSLVGGAIRSCKDIVTIINNPDEYYIDKMLSELKEGRNIFAGAEGDDICKSLLRLKAAGNKGKSLSIRDLFSTIKGLEFLALDTKPEIDSKSDLSKKRTSARKSMYTCLDALNLKNITKIIGALERDLDILGFKKREYRPYRKGFKSEQIEKACEEGDAAALKELITDRADIYGRFKFNRTALYIVSWHSLECIKLLIRSGVDIDARYDGLSALLHLSNSEKIESIQYLINAGATLLLRSDNNLTPLSLAKAVGKKDPKYKAVRDLIEKETKKQEQKMGIILEEIQKGQCIYLNEVERLRRGFDEN